MIGLMQLARAGRDMVPFDVEAVKSGRNRSGTGLYVKLSVEIDCIVMYY